MVLKNKINSDYITAFKEKRVVVKNLLSVVKGEIQLMEKNLNVPNLSDEEVTKILTKSLKSLKETANSVDEVGMESVMLEISVVESYLPKQMSEVEVRGKIKSIVSDGASNMSDIMKAFAGMTVDRKMVSEIAKEYLSK